MWVGGGAASAQRGRGGGAARVPREPFVGELMQHAPSVEMDPLNAFDAKGFGQNAFLHPSLMPLHIVADPGTSAPLPSVLGCYLPDLDSASISGVSSPSNCYIHIKDPSIRTLRNGDVWTVVIQNTVVARWVQDPDHLKNSSRLHATPVPAAPAQLYEQELGKLSLPQDPASVDFLSHVSYDPSRLLTAQPPDALKGGGMQHVDADEVGDGQLSGANAAFHSMFSHLPSAIHMRILKSEVFVNVLSENRPDADFSLVSGIRVCFAPLYVQINKAKTICNEGESASQNSKPTTAPFAPPGFFPASSFTSVPTRTNSVPTHHSHESQSDANQQLQGHTGIFMASNESCNGLPVYFSYPKIADRNAQIFFSMRLSLGETVLVCDPRGKKMAPSGKQTGILPARTLQPGFSFAEAKVGNFEVQHSQMSNVGGNGQLLWLLEERTFRPQESPLCKTIACCLTATSSLGSCVEILLRAKNAWMQSAESSALPPKSTVALSSQLPWTVSVSGSKGQRSFALNGQFLIQKVSFKYGFIRYRKMASHSVFLDYGIDIQQWIAHFRFQPSAYCLQQCNSGSGIRNPQVSSQAVTYVCDSLPSFGDIAPSKVYGICGKCALKLLQADCSFLPALIASSSPSAENIDNEKKFRVAVPVEWSAVTAVGNIDLEFSSGEAFGGDDGAWDPFGMGGFRGGFQGPGFRGRGGRGRMMRGRGRGRGNRGGRGHNLGFGVRNTSEAPGETAMRVPLPHHTASEGVALDVSNLVVTFVGALPHDAWSSLNSSIWCELNSSPTQFSPNDCHKPPSEAFSEHDSSNLGVCILPSLLASARCYETISKNQGLLSEFITQTTTSHGSTESALMNFVTLCSLANGRFSDLLASPVIGEHVFLSLITSVKRWSQHIDYAGYQDSVLSSCVPVSSAIKQLVQRMLSQSSFVQFPFRSCKVKYRDSDSDSQLEREGIVLSWTAAGELDVECEHPHRGSYERISESWITGIFLPNRPPIFPRVCGLLLQCFVYEMQRYISPITQTFIDRCSGVSDFLSHSDYMMRLFSASIAVLIARNTFDIGADVIAENLHPCAVISECSQCFLCEFEIASKDSNHCPSHGTTGSSDPPRLEISSSRVFFHHSIPQIVHSATLCAARSSVFSAKTATSCHEVMRWSLVNVNAGESSWAVFLVPCELKSTEATDIISWSGTLGLNFGLPNCSLTPIEIEYGQVVTVQVDAIKCEVIFVVNNRLVSTMSVPADKFPLHLAAAGCNSAFICILREPFSRIPAASFNCMLEDNSSMPFQDNSAAPLMHYFQVLENDSLTTGFAFARCLCWLRKAASSSLNFALDFSIQIPSVSLFFIVRDIAASLSPAASEYFKALHIVSEKLQGVLSPGVPRFSDRAEKPPLQIINAVHEHLMKGLTTSIIRIQDLLSLLDLHKNGKFKKFLFATLFQECVFPAIHSCIRQYLFEEVQRPSSLQTLSGVSPDSQSTLDGMLNTMFAGPEQDIFSDKLHLPLHTIVADAVRHHVECASKRRVWTMKVVDDNFSMESSRVCEAKDLNGIALFSIDIQSPPSPEDLAFQGDFSTPEFSLHFVVTHDNKSSRKTIKLRSVHNSELSISVDPFGVSFTLGQNKTDVEFKALGLAALISTVSFPLPHLCNSLEQPSVDVSRFSLAPKWVLKLALRSIDYITLDIDTLSLIRNLPRLVLDHFETVCFIPSTCSFFHSSVQFIISKIFKKRLNILGRDPDANSVFSQHLKSFVSRALASLQLENADDRRDHWQDFFTAYSALANASDTCFLSSYVHTSSRTSFVNEWTCLKRNDSSLIVHVSKPYSAVISTDVYPNVHEDADNFNPFHPPSKQIQESVTRLCHCSSPLPTGTSVINVKVCSSLQDRASFGLIFPTFQGDCTIGSTADSWGILCSGAIQHKGERRDFLSIVSGCIITLVYVSHSGSLTVSVNNEVVHVFFDLPSHSLRFAATLGNSVTEATLFEVDFVQSCLYPPIYHEGISSACTALREHCTTLVSCLDTIARIRHYSDSLLVMDNSKRLPLAFILLCAESVTCECLAQHSALPSTLTPTQCIDVAVLMSTFDRRLEAFIKKCCANAAVSNELLRTFMRCHLMTSSADVPLPSAMADIVVSIAVDQISSFSGDESSNFRDRARTIIVEMILSFLDFKTELGIEFPYVGSTLSLKSAPDAALVKPASFVEDDHSQSFFPFSEELAGKIDAIVMARSLYSFVEEQMPQALAYVVPNFFVMVLLSVKKRFSKKQITNQISATLDISASELSRLIVTVECFLRTWEMNDCKIDFGAGLDILGNHQGRQRQRELAFGFAGRPNWTRERRGRRQFEGDSDFQKEEKNEISHPVSLRNEWSSCALAPLEVGSVVCTSENFCLVQGPFSRRVLCLDQVKVIQGNKSPFFADSASSRAFLSKSNMVSSLTSAVTQRCLVVLPAHLKLHVCQHLQSLAENAVCALVLSSGIDASRFGIKLAADVPLFDQQVVEDALTAALNLATIKLSSEFSFSSRIPSSSAKIFAISRLLYAYDYLDKNECFPENQSSLADMFTGLQIIKKFLFQRFSQVKKHPSIFVSFSFV
jgi:hypothetical protein